MSLYNEPPKKEIPPLSLAQIAQMINGNIILNGASDLRINGVGSPGKAEKSQIVFILEKVFLERAILQRPGALVVEKGKSLTGAGVPLIEVSDVRIARIQILEYFSLNRTARNLGIHPSAIISPGALIGDNVTIMQNVVVMDGVKIGSHSVIYPNVTLEYDCQIGEGTTLYTGVVIGERCIIGRKNIIYSGTIIGTDGFNYYDKDNIRYKIPQIGIVETEDLVEIGANVCIDRATIHRTVIASETKIDNLVQIGHNCRIGKKCYIVSQVGISGSSNIGDEVILAGQVGIADHVNIGDRVMVLAKSGVPDDIAAGEKVFGVPARPVRTSHKINSALPRLPELLKRVSELEEKILVLDKLSRDN